MAYGIEITAQNGKIFATPETPFMHLTSRFDRAWNGTLLGNNAQHVNTGITSAAAFIVYARHLSGGGFHYAEPYQSGGTWWLKVWSSGAQTIRYYCFTNQVPRATNGYGLEIYAANGSRLYSSSTLPLQNHTGALGFRDVNSRIYPGWPTAVLPLPSQFWVQRIQGGANVQFFVGAAIGLGNEIKLNATGTGIMPSSSGFSFAAFGGEVNYIRSDLYD